MYLFFDTETTGLPRNWKAPVHDVNNWPRMVQIAWLRYDSQGKKIDEQNFIIKPEGFKIPEEASRIHGISTDRAMQEGVSLNEVLSSFHYLVTDVKSVVAHNLSFDEKIVGAEFLRNKMTNSLNGKHGICTMQSATDYCQLPGPYGYKWPKLSELHSKLFGEDFEEAHNASADINATARCFWEMKKLGWI